MRKYSSRSAVIVLGICVWLFLVSVFAMIENFTGKEVTLSEDPAMKTQYFNTDVLIGEDQSYQISEHIGVNFMESRQGIYRYVPYKGAVISKDESNEIQKVPYYARITEEKAAEPLEMSKENGNWVARIGTEGTYRTGSQEYRLSYKLTPMFQTTDYNNVYYNVIPNQWQNPIPSGSHFTITFPKSVEHDQLQFYYGLQGESKNAADILRLSWNDNTVTGILEKDLQLGEGITVYADLGEGYFADTNHSGFLVWLLLLPPVCFFLLILFLYLRFGRDEQIIPSIQYQPPEDLDSASVGYIIDGRIEDKDILSLIIYWADKRFLKVEELKNNELCLHKLKNLPSDAPAYQLTVFNKLFGKKDKCIINDLKYKFSGTMEMAKKQVVNYFKGQGQDGLYTKASKISRIIAVLCCALPLSWFMLITGIYSYTGAGRAVIQVILCLLLLIGSLIFCEAVDKWYAKSKRSRKALVTSAFILCCFSGAVYTGSYIMRVWKKEIFNYTWILAAVLVMTIAGIVMTGFMKRRTSRCIEWMGRLAGLRDFIETAELDRMKELAGSNPEWFYHIIPYAYVFGLSDVFAEKLKGLSLPAPEWYVPYQNYTFFDYYLFNSMMVSGLDRTASTLSIPKPQQSSGSGSSSGGFGGMSGGGGFSGGGFGGGGGGSW
jgi:uncharacterized membrane protein YgcG